MTTKLETEFLTHKAEHIQLLLLQNKSSKAKDVFEPVIQYIAKQSFKYEGEIKCLHAVRAFITQEIILKELLEHILQPSKNEPKRKLGVTETKKTVVYNLNSFQPIHFHRTTD